MLYVQPIEEQFIMTNTRDFNGLGVWAADAVTPVAPFPVPGTAYRDETVTETANKIGEPFKTEPDSAVFNQKMFVITSFIEMLEKHGTIGWSDQVDYVVPAIVWGSDSKFYFSIQPSGPGSSVRDPISEPTYWELVTSATQLRLDLESQVPGDEGSRRVGYNKTDINGGLDEGLTVKQALDEVLTTSDKVNQMKLIMSGSFSGATGAGIGNLFNVYQNKAIIVNPAPLSGYRVNFGDEFPEANSNTAPIFLVFVTTHATPDEVLPVGNSIPTVQGIGSFLTAPPPGNEARGTIEIFQYEMQEGVTETQNKDFDVLVLAVGPTSQQV